jgi:protein TonB
MQQPQHLIVSRGPKIPYRVLGLLFAGLIPAAFLSALTSNVTLQQPVVCICVVLPWDDPKHPPPPVVYLHRAKAPNIVPPVITTNDGPYNGIYRFSWGDPFRGFELPGSALSPVSIAATHTPPPYPPLAVRLTQQGTVDLKLEIGADGRVTNAIIEKSSGSAMLDRAAIEWIIAHWRYQPAMKNGDAIPAVAEAEIRFDLRDSAPPRESILE